MPGALLLRVLRSGGPRDGDGADYRFAPSRVAFAFTRGCSVKALGGILSVDVTPTLQGELAPTLRKVEHEIDAKLPPLRPQAARLWAELAKARPLPLGGCVLLHPRGLVQGPVTGNAETLRVRLGLVAEPEIQSRCSNAAAAKAGTAEAPPLPPLAQDPSLGPEDELVLALVSPLEQVDLSFREEGCHDATVRSSLAWGEGGKTFRLTAPTEALAGVRFQPPLPPDAIAELVPALAAGMSDAHLDVSAKITSVRPLDVTLRGDSASTEVAASVLVRGSVELKER